MSGFALSLMPLGVPRKVETPPWEKPIAHPAMQLTFLPPWVVVCGASHVPVILNEWHLVTYDVPGGVRDVTTAIASQNTQTGAIEWRDHVGRAIKPVAVMPLPDPWMG
jgi:hypothetical protein